MKNNWIIILVLVIVIIAEVLLRNKPLLTRLLTIVVGSIIYRFILAIVFEFNVEPSDSKIASAIVLVICLSLPQIQDKLGIHGFPGKKSHSKKEVN